MYNKVSNSLSNTSSNEIKGIISQSVELLASNDEFNKQMGMLLLKSSAEKKKNEFIEYFVEETNQMQIYNKDGLDSLKLVLKMGEIKPCENLVFLLKSMIIPELIQSQQLSLLNFIADLIDDYIEKEQAEEYLLIFLKWLDSISYKDANFYNHYLVKMKEVIEKLWEQQS